MSSPSYNARKRLAIVILLVALPAYIIVAVSLVNWLWPDPLNKPSILVELGLYVGLGVLWAFPLKSVFKGIGQADPDDPSRD